MPASTSSSSSTSGTGSDSSSSTSSQKAVPTDTSQKSGATTASNESLSSKASGTTGTSKTNKGKLRRRLQRKFESVRKIRCSQVLSKVPGHVYQFFRSEPKEHKTWKMMLGFPAGCLIGWGLYLLVIERMDLEKNTTQLVETMLVFGLAMGFSMATSVRCVCFLLVPTFMGKEGRTFLGGQAIELLVDGPISNIVKNGQDITRSLSCTAELIANHTAEKWKLRTDPLSGVLKEMQSQGFLLNDIGEKVNRAFRPTRVEIVGEEEVVEMEKRTEELDKADGGKKNRAGRIKARAKPSPVDGEEVTKKYKKKVELRCEDIYNKAIQSCKNIFLNIRSRCFDKLPDLVEDIICPIVNVGFLCDLIKVIGKAVGASCDADVPIMNSFGKTYKESEETMGGMDEKFDVNLQYKVVKTQEDVDYTSVEQMRSRVSHDFNQGRKWVDFTKIILRRILAFTFLFVVLGAYKYHKKYTTDIRFDNIYITSYFRKIDARRKQQEKRVLLPMKKIEATACISSTSLKMLKGERQKLVKGVVIFLARAVLAFMIFLLDKMLVDILNIIREKAAVDFKQEGMSHVEIKVGGTGVMSNIVRLFLNGLSGRSFLNSISSNRACLPNPSETETKYITGVILYYVAMLALVFLDSYALRLRSIIAAFFYRKRQKMRILHMYNTMLAKRKYFLLHMRRRVKRKAKELKLAKHCGLLYSLRRQFPGLLGWLSVFESSKNLCLICDDIEKEGFKACDTPGCTYMYCQECWCDIKGFCYACSPAEEFSSTDSSDFGTDQGDETAM